MLRTKDIVDVPPEHRASAFEIADLLRISADILMRRPGSLGALLPPLSWIKSATCTFDRRVAAPWCTEHGDAIRAAVAKYEASPVGKGYATQHAKKRAPTAAPARKDEDPQIDITDVSCHFGAPELRRRPSGPLPLPVASSSFIAPITRQRLMAGR